MGATNISSDIVGKLKVSSTIMGCSFIPHEFGYVGGLKKLTKGVGSRGLEGDAIRAAKDVLVVFGRMLASGTSWIVCVCAFVEFFICCPEAMHKFDSRTSLIIGGTCHRLFNRVPVDSVTDC